ncbi:MAG: endonuclease V [Myxococcales bacterium]|nr:endonuclease V [Myxococcales bacterium]MCB9645219.1 endonuclease V [Deltaproteobacteria bacterium]
MLACVDVDYRPSGVVAAALGFEAWADDDAREAQTFRSVAPPAPYQPGQFYRRELPYLLNVLGLLSAPPDTVIIDGYVWLADDAPGLGAHLFEALQGGARVVGVAKRPFRGATNAVPVLRGGSQVPLYVTAAGMPVDEAARGVAAMHGAHRLPTLLKRVDRLCRDTPLGVGAT